MRQRLKRLLAFFLAILTMVSSGAGGLLTMTANAASPQASIYFYYASAKAHGVISEYNSQHTGQILYAMIDNHIGYCMNYGLSARSGKLMDSSGEPSNTNLSDKQEKLLSYALYYGYAHTGTDEPSDDMKDEYIATQALVWNIVKGIFGTDSADSAAKKLCDCAPSPNHAYEYYAAVRNQVQAGYNQVVPSFTSKRQSGAETYELKWNETNQRFETTLTDSNGVLEDFDISLSGYSISRNGNQLTIYRNDVSDTATMATLNSNKGVVDTTSSCVFWFCGDSSYQEFISERPSADPLYAYFKVKTESIGYGYLEKVDASTGTKLAGAVYGIYSDSACTRLVQQMTTGKDGTCKSDALVAGTYYVREISAPRGYVLDKAVYTLVVTAGQTTSFKRADEEQTGAITIYKEGEVLTGWDGTNFVYEVRKLPGATFRVVAAEDIYRADGALVYHKGDIVADNLTTGKDGQVVVNNLHLGNYSVIETRSIDGFTINGNPVTVKIEYKDQTVSVQYEDATIRNERQHANVSVLKCDSVTKNPLSGGKYTLCAGNDIRNYDGTIIMHAGDVIQTVTTGRDGRAVYSVDLPIGNSYSVSETKAPYGYIRNMDDVYSFSFEYAGEDTATVNFTHTFLNDRVTAKIHLVKLDKETGKPVPQGDAKLEGAVYGLYAREDIVHPDGATGVIYKKDELVAELRTDANAEAEVKGLYLGEYYLKEIEAPVGYVPDTEKHNVSCTYEGDSVKEVVRQSTAKEQVIKQPFQLIKVSDDGKETEEPTLAGAEFTAYLKSSLTVKDDGSYDFASATPVVIGENGATTIVTDSKGYAVTIAIPYGTYVVVESKTPHNMQTIKPFEVTIREHKPTEPQVWRIFVDRNFKAKLRIIKIDADTKKPVLVPDTEFRIFNMDTDEYVELITTYPSKVVHTSFFTDEDGDLILPEALPCGNYRIEEVAAPYGYVKNKNYVEVKIDTDTFFETDPDTYEAIITVTYEDSPEWGRLTIEKKGEVLTGYSAGVFAKSEEGVFEYREAGLAGAVFEVYADEDIFTSDHQVDDKGNRIKYYSNGDLVATLTTDESGKAVLEKLPLGRYKIKEIKAPFGYILNHEEINVTFSYIDDDTEYVEQTRSFTDERAKLSILVEKRDAEDDRAISGAQFGLYAEEDIKDASGKVIIKADTLLERAVSDSDGRVSFKKDYPFGKYYAKELECPDGYVSSSEVIHFDAKYKDQETPVVEYSKIFLNKPTSFDFTKEDITSGAELSGATLSVIDSEGKVIETWTSRAGEKHVIKRLIVGHTYILREEYAPYGYLRAADIEFTVLDTETIQSVVMKDEVPTGTIVINKDGEFLKDATLVKGEWYDVIFNWFRTSMAGVTFDVYAKEDIVSPDGLDTVYYKKDELVGTITTNDKGIGAMEDLPLGEYYLVETKTLPGFVLDQTPIDADIRYIDQDTKIVYAGDNIFNERQKVEIKVIKKDAVTEEPLEGSIFGLYAKEDIVNTEGDVVLVSGNEVERAVTGSDGVLTFVTDLPLGKYVIREVEPPKGYASNDEEYEIDASYQDDKTKVLEFEALYKDYPIKVEFSKTDITGDIELPGAKLTVIDSEGKTIEAWTSTDKPHMIEKLPIGKYKLREEISPYGYKIATDVEFEVLDTGELQKVAMKDEVLLGRILVKKKDAEIGTMLDGVTFELRDKDGKVIASAVTGNDGNLLFDNLPICIYENGVYKEDITYTLVETATKDGYILDSTPHEVVLKYEGKAPEVVEVTFELTNQPTEPKLPQTGERFDARVLMAFGLLFLFIGGACIVVMKKKDESPEKQ